jgi:cystathionine beta-lyase/cystathionine gamma-synthase
VRAVERRTEAIQTRLDVATDRLRAWADLSKRMQQLSRQADALSRARGAPRPREAVETVANPGGTGPAGADIRSEDSSGTVETLVANAS